MHSFFDQANQQFTVIYCFVLKIYLLSKMKISLWDQSSDVIYFLLINFFEAWKVTKFSIFMMSHFTQLSNEDHNHLHLSWVSLSRKVKNQNTILT